MKTIRSILLPCLLLTSTLLLSSCGGNWLVGKWAFDKDRTLEVMEQSAPESPNASPEGGGLLKDIVGGLQKGFSRVMLTQFEGMQIEFTATEARKTRNGTGEALGYEIIETPGPDIYLVKTDDGTIATWEKVDSGIRLKLSGEADSWVYFRSAE